MVLINVRLLSIVDANGSLSPRVMTFGDRDDLINDGKVGFVQQIGWNGVSSP